MPHNRVREVLEASGVQYSSIAHVPAYSAQRIAAAAHVPGREFAKTVIIDVDGELAMAVQNAASRVPLGRIKAVAGARDVRLASEHEFRERFPDCETGAMPPFGNLYGMETFVTKDVAEDDEIVCNAGSHTESIKLHYRDFAKLVHPIVV
jgi:Ala-tRNA(Pro) deacylase